MKMKRESEISQSCPTLSNAKDYAHQAPPSVGFSRHLEWGAIAFSKRKLSTNELMLLNCGIGGDS